MKGSICGNELTSLRLDYTTEAHLQEIKSWLPDRDSCIMWGGPHMRYPFTENSFEEDIRLNELATYSMTTNEDGLLIGFGQIYEKLDRIHLARLIINPVQRGKNHGKTLIGLLLAEGSKKFSSTSASLFVYRFNQTAIRCYQKIGFTEQPYPQNDQHISHETMENIVFMVKPLTD